MADGTKDDPWILTTPPGSSTYSMFRDETGEPPSLVCQVGSTTLRYHLRAIEDLHSWLQARGEWVELGSADENKPATDGSVEAWARAEDNPLGGWYGLRKGYRGRFGMYMPPLLEQLGLAELTRDARNNKMRGSDWLRQADEIAPERNGVNAMPTTKVIRYKTTPDSAEENARLVAAVYAELAASDPGGLSYVTFRLDDGVSFIHIAELEGDDNPLMRSKAFAEFQEGIAQRCVEAPLPTDATVVGAYGVLP